VWWDEGVGLKPIVRRPLQLHLNASGSGLYTEFSLDLILISSLTFANMAVLFGNRYQDHLPGRALFVDRHVLKCHIYHAFHQPALEAGTPKPYFINEENFRSHRLTTTTNRRQQCLPRLSITRVGSSQILFS
jgi:hypothetical protein